MAFAPDYFARPAHVVAPDLLGHLVLVDGVGGLIAEVEAYEPQDAASHSAPGPTARNAAMFGPPGHAYVYRSYGLHWCLNVVCLPGHAVLLRALRPTQGLDRMAARRGVSKVEALCSGPGKLAQALGITLADNGRPLDGTRLALMAGEGPANSPLQGPRIGISRAVDLPWRWGVADVRWLSRRFPVA